MRTLLFLLFLLVNLLCYSQEYSRVRIYINREQEKLLHAKGVCIDHAQRKLNTWVETDLSADEIAILRNENIRFDVVIADVVEHYQNQSASRANRSSGICESFVQQYSTPANFELGSMGGYPNYSEVIDELDSMALLYPSLIKSRVNIGSIPTHNGNFVQWLKISDNPNVDEGEPEILLSALHHAREPMSVTQLLYFMWFLLENYGTNAEVTYLVDNTEIYLVPIINPDGYIHNGTIAPGGGGMWRKNRRNNGDGTFGVDLNRNYDHQWGFSGTSTSTTSDVYLGPIPFSEPETQSMRDFCIAHQFEMALNFHSYGDWLLHPFGYDYVNAYHHNYLQSISGMMVSQNGYANIRAVDLYPASGDSDDWMYDDTIAKPRIFAMTPEVGPATYGFWPPSTEIENLSMEMVYHNLTALHVLHYYGVAADATREVFRNPVPSQYFKYEFKKLGLKDVGTTTVNLISLSPFITAIGAGKNYTNLSGYQILTDSIGFTIALGTPEGSPLKFVLQTVNAGVTYNDTITKYFGVPFDVYNNNFTSISGMMNTGFGTTSTSFVSPSLSLTDSPGTDYGPGNNKTITTPGILIPPLAVFAQLRYWSKWEIEKGYDYSQVLITNDGGSTWYPLCAPHMSRGTNNQEPGEPLYDGVQTNWILEEINLNDYIGQNIQIRFSFKSDPGVEMDGIYFDDAVVEIMMPSGINEYIFANDLRIFPDPASQFVHVNSNEAVSYVLTDLKGNIVLQGVMDGNNSIPVASVKSGMYALTISDQKGNRRSFRIAIVH